MADPTLITPNSRNSDRVSFILDTDWKTVLGDSYEETFLKYETTFDFTSYNNTWNSREVEPTNSTGDCQKSLLGSINVSIDKDNSDYRESIQNFYKRIYNVLKHSFGNNFDKFYSNQYPQIKFNNNEDIVFSDRSEQISNMDMKDLRNHIFLFVSTQDVKSST